MKLSYLVSYRNYLIEQKRQLDTSYVVKELAPLLDFVQTHAIRLDSSGLEANCAAVDASIMDFTASLDQLIDTLAKAISHKEKDFYKKSLNLYARMLESEQHQSALERHLKLNKSIRKYVLGRLLPKSDWRFPGLIVRPGKEVWINHLVGLDPLYLADTDLKLLEPARLQFNHLYQNRLRLYTAHEQAEKIFPDMPQAQMGFVLVYNFFNYKPLPVILRYLTEIFDLLRPGGSVHFTINDCDYHGAVELVEKNYMMYTPFSQLEPQVSSIGYHVQSRKMINSACAWIELTKPGQLDSIRAGQALARIVAR